MEDAAGIKRVLEGSGAAMVPWGPALPDGSVIEVAESFGAYEAEYAAVRQRVGVMDLPMRGFLRLTGADVKDFLHRLLTCEVNERQGGDTFAGMQLTDDGKIVADLVVHYGDASTWLETDVFDLEPLRDVLEKRLFVEDVVIEGGGVEDQAGGGAGPTLGERGLPGGGWRLLWLLGPAAVRLLAAVSDEDGAAERVGAMAGTHHVMSLGGADATAYRWDLGGVLGLRLWVKEPGVVGVYQRLLDAAGYVAGEAEDGAMAERRRAGLRGRPVGWSAVNTVRVESGVVWPHIDFGPDSQPAELGKAKFESAVSLTKGCYLGQEAVARMHNLSHPKRVLVGLKLPDDRLPIAGAQVFEGDEAKRAKAPRGGVIGAVTSSAQSPLRGQQAVGIAMMKWGKHRPGTAVAVAAEGGMVDAAVCELGE